ncbi:MAG TPA: glycosyltransferase family 39 protein [Sandaracinaceae bacterium LLY-WYZ-13_1]|nr:glycosyltransferase family 39 protein [Sandaracinaceae bacterium LLY-WYZ-13_1]
MRFGARSELGWREAAWAVLAATAWVSLIRPGPLDLAYFWDEADVYVPGARWVAEHGLTVTPGVFPDDYSRGHPPLLYLLAGAAFAAFGPDPTVGHLVVLPFTVLALAGTYLLGATVFSRRVGLAAALLLGTTPLFLSIGNMLLPEMPLVALTVVALLAFARGRLGLAVLAGVAMVWIKETGIFSAAAIGVGVLVDARLRRERPLRRVALATAPLFALLGFFAWQKVHAGYFVFPHHQNLFADRPLGWENVATVWPSLLGWHGRWLLAAAAILALTAGRRDRRAPAPTSPWRPTRGAVVAACVALVLFNALFFTKMFWLERYALPAHPGLLVVLCAAILGGFERLPALARPPARWIPIGAAAFAGVAGLWAPTASDAEEHTFAYADVIATHRAAFAILEDDDAPVLTTWPMTVELEQPYLGYVEEPRPTVHARHLEDDDPPAFGAVLVNTASWRADALRAAAARRGLTHAATVRRGVAPALELHR